MKIVMIGAGNLATHFGIALKKSGHEIIQVFSRSSSSAKELSKILKCSFTIESGKISSEGDCYVISISDQAIKEFLKSFNLRNKTVLHTSGSVPMRVFGKKFKDHGVIYPVQTFSKERRIKFKEVPLLIEASNAKTLERLYSLAASVSAFVFQMSSDERKTVHLAAVIANNFTNHLFIQAEKILMKFYSPFPLLGPLLHETVVKALNLSPRAAQTGPAKRGDATIIAEHLKMLNKDASLLKIYQLLSESIEKESGIKL